MAAKLLPEFFSEWHQERYISDMKRDLAAAQSRLEQLKELGLNDADPALVGARRWVEDAHRELRRLGVEKKPAK